MEALCRARGIRRSFVHHGQPLEVLRGIDFDLAAGERVSITGPSGAGKSTLLAILGLVDAQFEGDYRFRGRDVATARAPERAAWRLREMGFAFQDLHLVPSLTALENVALPALAAGRDEEAAKARGRELLAAAGLASRAGHLPGRLSGGERRRVAFARALANGPKLLLVDEPTGDLDEDSARGVVALMDRAADEGAGIVAVTHDPRLVAWCPRHCELLGGVLHGRNGAPDSP